MVMEWTVAKDPQVMNKMLKIYSCAMILMYFKLQMRVAFLSGLKQFFIYAFQPLCIKRGSCHAYVEILLIRAI